MDGRAEQVDGSEKFLLQNFFKIDQTSVFFHWTGPPSGKPL
jgi:hypothetical protein